MCCCPLRLFGIVDGAGAGVGVVVDIVDEGVDDLDDFVGVVVVDALLG